MEALASRAVACQASKSRPGAIPCRGGFASGGPRPVAPGPGRCACTLRDSGKQNPLKPVAKLSELWSYYLEIIFTMDQSEYPARWISRAVGGSPLLVTLWKTWRQHWWNALLWGIFCLTGSLLPLWATLFIRGVYGHPYRFEDFVLHGDLALYAAAFLAPAIYQIIFRMKNHSSFLGVGAVILAIMALLFSAIVYMVVNPELVAPAVSQQIHDYTLLNFVSYSLLLAAVAFSVFVFLNEQQLAFEDLAGAEKIDQEVLISKVEMRNPEPANATPLAAPPSIDEQEDQEVLMEEFTPDLDEPSSQEGLTERSTEGTDEQS